MWTTATSFLLVTLLGFAIMLCSSPESLVHPEMGAFIIFKRW
nr:MAG TPA: Fibrinogen binding protein [Caudoviricetes sp.]